MFAIVQLFIGLLVAVWSDGLAAPKNAVLVVAPVPAAQLEQVGDKLDPSDL
jgi:hypothetical protein